MAITFVNPDGSVCSHFQMPVWLNVAPDGTMVGVTDEDVDGGYVCELSSWPSALRL